MMPPPLVSVVVPMFNTERYITAAIDSTLHQTYASLEVVVVDDGSTDRGAELVLAIRDPRVRYVHQPNRGLSAARNRGIQEARGEVIAFLDSDDLWLPKKLARQVEALHGGVVYSDAYLMRDGGHVDGTIGERVRLPRNARFEDLIEQNVVPVLTTILPRRLLEMHGGFDETLRSAEDLELWLRLAAAGVEFRALPEPLAVYRIRPGALSSDPVWMAQHRLAAFRKTERLVDGAWRDLVRLRISRERALLAGELSSRAWARARAGEVADAKKDMRESFVANPSARRALAAATSLTGPTLRLAARFKRSRKPGGGR